MDQPNPPIEKLTRQYQERGRIIQLLENKHTDQLRTLFTRLKRLRHHRLALVIALEIFIGAAIIGSTITHDQLDATRTQATDLVRIAQHQKDQTTLIQQDQKEMHHQYIKIIDRFQASQKKQSQLKSQLTQQNAQITEARKMITHLIKATENPTQKFAKK